MTALSPDQKAAAIPVILLGVFVAACITGVLLYALSCGQDGIMVAGGVAVLGGIVGVVTGHKLRDILGK